MVVELAKEFEIQGRICNLPLEMTEEELLEDDAEGGYFDDLAYYEEDD